MESEPYKKILSLGLRDISSPIQIKNQTYAFGWRMNDNIYPPDGPANTHRSFNPAEYMDWFDKNGKFREIFVVLKNGDVRKYELGVSSAPILKKFKSPFSLQDWEGMLDFVYEYLVKKYLPALTSRGVTYWNDEEKAKNLDYVAIKTLFEDINNNMEQVLLFEEYDKVSSGSITIPYEEGGPLHWSGDSKTFSGELSDLRQVCPDIDRVPRTISVKSKEGSVTYVHSKTDYDGSHEDIYGWNYTSINGKFESKLLIIND